uniref:hypothetical protein n=1 Tax=Altererythrobacter segetis TaxID=1104773 RepID=UPI00140E74AB|nr:hypothetical protein [Altererythrobacter segetis]
MTEQTLSSQNPVSWSPPEGAEFEFAKAVFEQNFAQFRHLNDQMNRLPAFAVTLTGGFWYVAVVVANYGPGLDPTLEHLARWALLIFAGLCNFTLVCIAIRIRDVMGDYLERVRRFEGIWWTERTPSLPWFREYSMISMYSLLIIAGGVLSWAAAFVLFWPSEAFCVWWGILIVVCALVIVTLFAYWIPRWLTPKST